MVKRLPFQTVNWTQSATAASKVMAPGGQLQLNVWTRSQAEVDQIIKAFTDAGFKNVRNMTPKPFDVGAGTVIVGTK